MQQNSFYKQLLIIFLALTSIQYLISYTIPELSQFQNLFWICQFFFVALSILSFYGGKYFVHQKSKNTFSTFLMGLIMFRLLCSVAIIIGYFNIVKPTSKLFLLPFFVVYLVYSIYEVYFLSKIGREN
jgi:hypothetical protein